MSEENKSSVGAKIGSFFGAMVMLSAGVAGGWIACEMWPKGDAGAAARAAAAMAAARGGASVAAVAVEERLYNLPLRFVAHAEPVQEVELLPQVEGYIKQILFKEGDIVKAGDTLYVLDGERYEAIVNQRKADLETAEAEARRAERYWERMQKADARGITQHERDNAEAGADAAKASVLQAKANLVVAEYDLKKTRVTAPIAGQIGKTSAHVGDYVAPSKGILARIVQIDPIRVSFPMTDRAYIAWRSAQKSGKDIDWRLRLLLADGSEYSGLGDWAFDDNTMSKETATIIMRLVFPNPDRMLIPNSYVTLLADRKRPAKVPCVPQQALIDLSTGARCVWVLKDDMTVESRIVETREMFEGWVPVDKGLKVGEKVVVSGMSKLVAGMKVKVVEATANDDLDKNYRPPVKEK